jgi:hypothetical protein
LSLAETFSRIYSRNIWASSDWDGSAPYSGPGAYGSFLKQYAEIAQQQIVALGVTSLADLGCGDFSVGKVLAGLVRTYKGLDVSPAVIDYHRKVHSAPSVSFICGDLTQSDLPPADIAVVRQVLQHLSNAEIQLVLANVARTYSLALVSEHIYIGRKSRPNLDIPHGPETRVPLRSGVFIDLPPFSLPSAWVSDIDYGPGEVLRTWLFRSR